MATNKAWILTVVALVAVLCSAFMVQHLNNPSDNIRANIRAMFVKFEAEARRQYQTPAERDHRARIFQTNAERVAKWEAEYKGEKTSNMFDLGQWADIDDDEFKGLMKGNTQSLGFKLDYSTANQKKVEDRPATNLGQGFQMRVRHQGSCGSCWAHTTIAIAEKKYFQLTNRQVDLSMQELVDCDTTNNGCTGGYPIRSAYYIQNNGISLASAYPYKSQ